MSLDKTTTPPEQEKQENQALENVAAGLGLSSRIIAILAKTSSRTFDVELQIAREAHSDTKDKILEVMLGRVETALEALRFRRRGRNSPLLKIKASRRAKQLFQEKPPTTALEALRVRSIALDKSLQDSALELAEKLFPENPPKTALEALEVGREAPDKSPLQDSALKRAGQLFQEKPPTTALEALRVRSIALDKSLQDSALELAEKLFPENPPTTALEALRVRSIAPDKSPLQDRALELAEKLFQESPPQTALEALRVRSIAPDKSPLQDRALKLAKRLLKESLLQTVLKALRVRGYAPDKSLRDRALELAKRLFEESPPQIFTEARETYEEALSCLGFLESETVKAMLQRMIDLAEGADRKSTYALILEKEQGIQLDRDILNALLAMERRSLQEETRQSVAGAVNCEQAV